MIGDISHENGEYRTTLDAEAVFEAIAHRCNLTTTDVARVKAAEQRSAAQPQQVIVDLGLAPEEQVARALADVLDLPFLGDMSDVHPDADLVAGFDPAFRRKKKFLPIRSTGGTIQIALTDPLDDNLLRLVGFHAGVEVSPIVATEALLARLEPKSPHGAQRATVSRDISDRDAEVLRDRDTDGPVVNLIDQLLVRAVERGASDIHFDTTRAGVTARFRLHGRLAVVHTETQLEAGALTARIKVLAGLNVSERRLPQDGRITRVVRGREVDFRVSTLPTQHGESVVVRVLDRNRHVLGLSELGFGDGTLAQIGAILDRPHGLFLVTGPTGSGKTTTLYAALSRLNTPDRKICSIEDPVEYDVDGVSQSQVSMANGFDFATALRAILRQDPNVVMIGEIRDAETARIACRAALIGRLVLSTLHVNSPAEARVRLRDLGVDAYLVDAVLLGSLGQSLVPQLCQACAGSGCEACETTGTVGRTLRYELQAAEQM